MAEVWDSPFSERMSWVPVLLETTRSRQRASNRTRFLNEMLCFRVDGQMLQGDRSRQTCT